MTFDLRNLALLPGLLFCLGVTAQDYPSKPVRIIVGSAPGGPVDTAARVVAQKLLDSWRQPVTVENRIGASEMIGAEFVAKATPDGHTLLMVSLNPFTINPSVFAKLPYDPVHSFASIVLVAVNPMVLVANPKASFNSMKELVAAAKSRPGEIAWSTPGLATSNHIAGEWFAAETGIKLFHIPYKGGPAAVSAVISGDVPLGIVSLVQVLPFVKVGTVKVLAVTTEKRTSLAPDWPTVAELGVPGFDASVRVGLFAPAGTPSGVIARINSDINRVLQLPEMRERFATLGVEPVGSTPGELDVVIARLRAKTAQIVEQAKIKPQ
jgi:tripartite-type tricarboxylate transporter receptor subunit TctC